MDKSFFDLSRQQAQQSYMDLHSLQNIRKTSGDDTELGLRQVAQQFESMFIQMMLKSMRSANDVFGKDNPLNTFESEHYRDMYDNQLSVSLSGNNLGIADAFYRQMSRNFLNTSNQSNNTHHDGKYSVPEQNLSPKPFYQEKSAVPYHQGVSLSANAEHIPQRIKDAALIKSINNPREFISLMAPYAKKAAESMGVDYRVLLAQSALETGWGEHIISDKYGNQSFNLFNIKADSRWEGKSVSVPTLEYINGVAKKEQAQFRRYGSIEESFNDYREFLQQPRYKKAMSLASDAVSFINALHQAGYATDPKYSEKIQRIMKQAFSMEPTGKAGGNR